jgi:hypothetical protein
VAVPSGLYSGELALAAPAAGIWKLRVIATDAVDRRFRVRAKLEGPRPSAPPSTPVLPNMQVMPPYDCTFSLPLTNGGVFVGGDHPTGIPMPAGVLSCHPEELAQGAVRCLRMAFGVRNVGQGPMYFRLEDEGALVGDQPLYQRVYNADRTYVDRPAGTAEYHATHAHHHQGQAVALELLEVTDPARGSLTPAAAERRKGFHHRDELLREWRHFYPLWEPFGFGLSPGWADYYEWDRPDNFIDFGLNANGRYVVRMTADPAGKVLESNEVDNLGYSYIEVADDGVKVLESGRGSDPWDRCKIVMPIGADPDLPDPASPRPADCPPDTVWPAPPPAAAKKTPKKARKAPHRCRRTSSKRRRKAKRAEAARHVRCRKAKPKRRPKRR